MEFLSRLRSAIKHANRITLSLATYQKAVQGPVDEALIPISPVPSIPMQGYSSDKDSGTRLQLGLFLQGTSLLEKALFALEASAPVPK